VLQCPPDVVGLTLLECVDCQIDPVGGGALGASLAFGMNASLVSLVLDHNITLGADGVRGLCVGLRTNSLLRVRARG
jgi:hypothetical protein